MSLFRAKTVQQRPLLPREVETWFETRNAEHFDDASCNCHKLAHSISRSIAIWFRSYLTGRTQVFTTHSGHTLPVPLMACLKALVLAQPNLSRTRSVPPLPFPHTQSNTTCSQMILSPTVTVKFLKLHY